MDGVISKKPKYHAHRRDVTTADTAVLADLLTARSKGMLHAEGFDVIEGFVHFTAGAAPSCILQLLELVEYQKADESWDKRLITRATLPAAIADGEGFSFDTPGGGRYLIRIDTLNGVGATVDVYVAGSNRDPASV